MSVPNVNAKCQSMDVKVKEKVVCFALRKKSNLKRKSYTLALGCILKTKFEYVIFKSMEIKTVTSFGSLLSVLGDHH